MLFRSGLVDFLRELRLVFVFIGCTRLAGSDYPMDTKFLTLSTCIIVDGSGTPLFKKVTDDVSKVSQDDAALVLKMFLLSKIKEDEE